MDAMLPLTWEGGEAIEMAHADSARARSFLGPSETEVFGVATEDAALFVGDERIEIRLPHLTSPLGRS